MTKLERANRKQERIQDIKRSIRTLNDEKRHYHDTERFDIVIDELHEILNSIEE